MIVYKTTNLINGKIYIGQDSNNNPKYFGSGNLINKALKKYGIENFSKEILEYCESKKDLDEKEKYWIRTYNSTDMKIGYNISEGGTGGKLTKNEWKKGKTYEEVYGIEKAKQLKELFSKMRKGKEKKFKNITSVEVGRKISNSLLSKNIIKSIDEKKNISNKLKEFFKSDKGILNKNKISELNKNKKQTEESNKKRSLKLKGKKPKKLDVHPSSQYWFFYDCNNNLILETLGNRTKKLKELNTNQRRIVIFNDLDECLNYKLPKNKHYKVYTKKYYVKK